MCLELRHYCTDDVCALVKRQLGFLISTCDINTFKARKETANEGETICCNGVSQLLSYNVATLNFFFIEYIKQVSKERSLSVDHVYLLRRNLYGTKKICKTNVQ